MKKALVNPDVIAMRLVGPDEAGEFHSEPIPNSYTVADVVNPDDIFEVASPLEWKDCDDNVTGYDWYWDTINNTFVQI